MNINVQWVPSRGKCHGVDSKFTSNSIICVLTMVRSQYGLVGSCADRCTNNVPICLFGLGGFCAYETTFFVRGVSKFCVTHGVSLSGVKKFPVFAVANDTSLFCCF